MKILFVRFQCLCCSETEVQPLRPEEISKKLDSVAIHHKAYTVEILQRFAHLIPDKSRIKNGQSWVKKVKTPLPAGWRLSRGDKATESKEQRKFASRFPYQQVIGALMYLAINSRPDILYAIIALSRQNKDPSYLACKAAVHILSQRVNWCCSLRGSVDKWLFSPLKYVSLEQWTIQLIRYSY